MHGGSLGSRRCKAGGILAVLGALSGGCAHGHASVVPEPPRAAQPPLPEDLTPSLIAQADAHLAAGQSEAGQGHLNKARDEFDEAVAVYLTAPGGA